MIARLISPALTAYSAAPPDRPRRFLSALVGAIALAAGPFIAAAPASAESVLTMHIEEQTSWVQNFNSFDLGGAPAVDHGLRLRAAGHLQRL